MTSGGSDASVFIAGHYYGFHNLGDEAILRSMVAHLREHRPDLRISVSSGLQESKRTGFSQKLNITASERDGRFGA